MPRHRRSRAHLSWPAAVAAMACAALLPLRPAGASLLELLAEGAPVHCTPALPYLCANIHVACAGRSRLAAPHLVIRQDRTSQRALTVDTYSASPRRPHARHSGRHLVHGSAPHSSQQSIVARLDAHGSYLKLTADGTFSYRTYRGAAALMAYGSCTALRQEDEHTATIQ